MKRKDKTPPAKRLESPTLQCRVGVQPLRAALKTLKTVVPTKTSVEFLTYCCLSATNGILEVQGYDGCNFATIPVPADVTTPGALMIGHARLMRILDLFAVTGLESTDLLISGATLKAGTLELTIADILSTDDFPLFPPPDPTAEVILCTTWGELSAHYRRIQHTIGQDPIRAILTGVCLCEGPGGPMLVATDTHRLKVVKLPPSSVTLPMTPCVLPRALFEFLSAAGLNEDDGLLLQRIKNRVRVAAPNGAMIEAALLAGTYPNWEKILPSETTVAFELDRKALKAATIRALIVARDNANRVRLTFTDRLTLWARSEEFGQISETIWQARVGGETIVHEDATGPHRVEVAPFEIALNGVYLRDALTSMTGERVRIEATTGSRPVVLRDPESADLEVVMPMALA
jgi:DNA polymerase III subunit beta